jgi:hypothetical protein
MSVNKYSTTPGSNLTVGDGADAVGLQEGMPRADVNNAMRTILADQAKAYIDGAGIVTTGTGSAYLVTTSSDYTAYTAGMNIVVQLHADALVNATVNVNSLGARTLKMRGATGLVNWAAGIAKAGDYVELFYNGTSFYAAGVGSAPVNNGTHTGTTTVGSLVATTADINAGTIDGTVIGATTPAAATVSSLVATTADINAGTIDGTVIGATTPAAGTFTTILGNGSGISGIVAGITFYRKTANYTAVHQDGVIADTTAGTFTVTLPAAPAVGDYVVISDGGSWATTNLTVGRNGKTIEGDAADMTMDLGGVHVTFVYDGFTWQIYVTGAYPSKGLVDNATATAMTLDASGNVIVGEASTGAVVNSTGGTGAYISADGQLVVSNVSNRSIFNRKTTDGDIIEFRENGTKVGSIATFAANDIAIGSDTTGLRFYDGSNADGGVGIIVPWNLTTNSARDAQMNLGSSTERFRSAYLSGGVYLGGTGAANKLDDYEEGFFTPNTNGTGTPVGGPAGYYTKVGQVVHIEGSISIGVNSNGASCVIGGFPFTGASNTVGGFYVRYTNQGAFPFLMHFNATDNTFNVYFTSGGAAAYSDFSGKRIDFVGSYRTSA